MSDKGFDVDELRKGFNMSIEMKMDEASRKSFGSLFFELQLEYLVPPADLCEKMSQNDFYGSSLAWYMNQKDPTVRVVLPRYSDVPGWVLFAPAPTLMEIMNAIHDHPDAQSPLTFRVNGDWGIDCYYPDCKITRFEAIGENPMSAAAMLWLTVTGVLPVKEVK